MLFRVVLPQCLAWPRVEDEEGSDVWVRSVSERGRGEVLGCCSPLGRARERKGGGPRGIERGRAGPTEKKRTRRHWATQAEMGRKEKNSFYFEFLDFQSKFEMDLNSFEF